MAERHYPPYGISGRSATFNPARASMPSMPMGYNPVYPGDIHDYPTASSRYDNGHARYHYPTTSSGSRGQAYVVDDDAGMRGRAPRDANPGAPRARRSSTIDSSNPRPIIITTAPTTSRTHGHAVSGRNRSRSPLRDEYRSSEPHIQRTSSSRPRSMSRHGPSPFSPTFDTSDIDYSGRTRGPDLIIPASGRSDAFRSSRPTVMYPSNPRHTAIDIGDQYGYTKPGELVQYDLDNSKSGRSHSRHESFDHYARPNVYYHPERRGFSIETNRTHDQGSSLGKSVETRGGPPPTTRGLDKLNRHSTMYDIPPPASALAPSQREIGPPVPRERRASNRHARPVSLYQDAPPRSSQTDDFHRSRTDGRARKEPLDYDSDSVHHYQDRDVFYDDDIGNRGFGIRMDRLPPDSDDRRDRRQRARREFVESARRSDDELDRDWDRIDIRELDDKPDRSRRGKQPSPVIDEPGWVTGKEDGLDSTRKLKDNLKAGLGIAMNTVGLGPILGKDSKADAVAEKTKDEKARDESKGSPSSGDRQDRKEKDRRDKDRYHRVFDDDDLHGSSSDDVEIITARPSGRHRPREKVYISKDRSDRFEPAELSPAKSDHESRDGRRRDGDPGSSKDSPASHAGPSSKPEREPSHSEDEADRPRRRGRLSFNPNDADDLRDIKEKIAAMSVADKQDKQDKQDKVVVIESPAPRREVRSGSKDRSAEPPVSRRDPSRGRSAGPADPASDKVVARVVSPSDSSRALTVAEELKPIRGILKTPSTKFPEDPNPIREGVAPHKNDEKLREVPPGARWTRISRKIVNPEALEVGKERYEVRDDFVIVLRVLSKEEIQTYAAATAVLRERRLKEFERAREYSDDDVDDERRSRHRRYRDREEHDEDEHDERERSRRHARRHRRHAGEDDDDAEGYRSRHHRRSYRERERDQTGA